MSINPGSEDPLSDNVLAMIKRGMTVVDIDGDDVGKVSYVQMADLNEPGDASEVPDHDVEVLTPNASDTGGVGAILDDLFDGRDGVTERMRHRGYVKIDATGWFAGDKYVEPHQIGGVEGDTVRLTIDKDAIEKPA